jgi:hypothetical protein
MFSALCFFFWKASAEADRHELADRLERPAAVGLTPK